MWLRTSLRYSSRRILSKFLLFTFAPDVANLFANTEVCKGASSPIRRVVSDRLQSAESEHSGLTVAP
jgi:hypothetical protein